MDCRFLSRSFGTDSLISSWTNSPHYILLYLLYPYHLCCLNTMRNLLLCLPPYTIPVPRKYTLNHSPGLVFPCPWFFSENPSRQYLIARSSPLSAQDHLYSSSFSLCCRIPEYFRPLFFHVSRRSSLSWAIQAVMPDSARCESWLTWRITCL